MKALHALALGLTAASLAGCETTGASAPTQVTRFHLGAPLERGTLNVEPMPGNQPASLEFKTFAAAVQTELLKAGYDAPAPGAKEQYLAVVALQQDTREGPPRTSGLTIGLGGGGVIGGGGGYRGGGGGVGLGGGVSFPVGKVRHQYFTLTNLSVTIQRARDKTVIWEGRAQTATRDRAPGGTAAEVAAKLADAMFRGFPGESGRTITVK
ncbi:DUF4136 domain-containing protein [Sphingomonas immobilis]|uniref:DUF4136 domain-containing protein n=1 Tax=Sphingomonas immobilis TaxID=3063997 RepID=A0ABT9A5K6_9SPHN|nr:DUF4136 domain-containing protein [Sphingomonas sp. CA1-15]MDO7844639.1 DUF4136 domain-containing protein [Sphingomonas sp. CA1-15]